LKHIYDDQSLLLKWPRLETSKSFQKASNWRNNRRYKTRHITMKQHQNQISEWLSALIWASIWLKLRTNYLDQNMKFSTSNLHSKQAIQRNFHQNKARQDHVIHMIHFLRYHHKSWNCNIWWSYWVSSRLPHESHSEDSLENWNFSIQRCKILKKLSFIL